MKHGKGPRPEVLVIGGGATGAGIARDLAMRGTEVLLAEAADLSAGASGANHGMLHSGARYVVKDPTAAEECASESAVLKRIASYCVEDHGGLFVSLTGDDLGYGERFPVACRAVGVEARELTPQEALGHEPGLNPDLLRAFTVPDASIDPFFLVWGNVESAREAGAEVRNHCPLAALEVVDGSIARAKLGKGSDMVTVKPELIINAAGGWAGRVAAMAGVRAEMRLDKGTMVVMNGRTVNGLVNRLRPPSDGDIIVPHRTSTILGTTSSSGDLARIVPTEEEVNAVVREASAMVPSTVGQRAVRAYAGIRPLPATGGEGRGASRGFRIIDHGEEGVDNLLTVVGGKLTTYRLMAEKASDAAMSYLGRSGPCRTAVEDILSPTSGGAGYHEMMMASRYGSRAAAILECCRSSPLGMDELCSCEAVTRGEAEHFASTPDVASIGDLMRRTRAGMGFCQGGLCAFHLASCLPGDPVDLAEEYMAERWKGVAPVLGNEQLRQEAYKAHLFRTMGLDHTAEDGR